MTTFFAARVTLSPLAMLPAYLGQCQCSLGHWAPCQRDCNKASPFCLLPASQHEPGTISPFYRCRQGSLRGGMPWVGGRHCWVGVQTGASQSSPSGLTTGLLPPISEAVSAPRNRKSPRTPGDSP